MKKIAIIPMILICAACAFQTKHRGYVFPDDLESRVANIKTTSELQEKIGDPLAKTIYGTPVWVYYGMDENYRGPLPHTYDNKTVLLAWVDGNRVTKTQILHDQDLPTIAMDDDETEIPAAIELNALQELFNNIGRFSPAGMGQ